MRCDSAFPGAILTPNGIIVRSSKVRLNQGLGFLSPGINGVNIVAKRRKRGKGRNLGKMWIEYFHFATRRSASLPEASTRARFKYIVTSKLKEKDAPNDSRFGLAKAVHRSL